MTHNEDGAGPVQHERKDPSRGADAGQGILIALAALFSGAAIMIIELTGTRLLAPWFGNSLYTWTGLIGVILISISCGYYFGGLLVDRRPRPILLAHLLAVSAALVCIIPLLYPRLEEIFAEWGIVRGPIVVAALLFALPGCCLASIVPFSIRLMSLRTADQKIGLSSGYVGMFGTLGSVAGTFATGFVLVPNLELRTIFLLTGAALGGLALAGYALNASAPRGGKVLGFILTFLWVLPSLGILLLKPPLVPGLLLEKYSFYHRIRVIEESTDQGLQRTLYLDSTIEGAQYQDSGEFPLHYQNYWRLAEVFCPLLESAAFLGGGAFAMPQALSRRYPTASVDVAEIDPEVIEVGRQYFKLDDYPRVIAVPLDARRFLRTGGKKYDFIFGDAYSGVLFIPAHLVTAEFFEVVKASLKDDGIYVMNIVSPIAGEHAAIFETIVNTLSSVFPHTYIFQTDPDPSSVQNVILMASNQPRDIIQAIALNLHDTDLAKLLNTYTESDTLLFTRNDILTDEANPIDYLVSKSLR